MKKSSVKRYSHRFADAVCPPEVFGMNGGFSIFDFLEKKGFHQIAPIHRCFSIARSFGADEFICEQLDTNGVGIVKEENVWLKTRFPGYRCGGLWRISFWKTSRWFWGRRVPIGILMVKTDSPNDGCHDTVTHVFEAVFPKYPHVHNCVHAQARHTYKVKDRIVDFHGVLFAQQNGLSKCCAHVALYSLLEGRDDIARDVSFSMMNVIAFGDDQYQVDFSKTGLSPEAIERILKHYDVNFRSIPYEAMGEAFRKEHDYAGHVYAGAESGYGALLGFELDAEKQSEKQVGERGEPLGHIIPVYGHTFNKDTWAPDANRKYFSPNKVLGYMPSDLWMSSFIAHDDNVGANLCIPRGFIRPKNVQYVVELLPAGYVNSAVEIGGQALQILHSIKTTDRIVNRLSGHCWFRRLCEAIESESLILRTLPVRADGYAMSLKGLLPKNDILLRVLSAKGVTDEMNAGYWLVEVSLPQLFPANEKKVADLLFNAFLPLDIEDRTNFSFARVPGGCLFPTSKDDFGCERSAIDVPVPNFVKEEAYA